MWQYLYHFCTICVFYIAWKYVNQYILSIIIIVYVHYLSFKCEVWAFLKKKKKNLQPPPIYLFNYKVPLLCHIFQYIN